MKRIMLVVVMLMMTGCTVTRWHVDPAVIVTENEYMSVKLFPVNVGINNDLYNHFALTVKNKTDKLIEINWNKTNFILQGMSRGGFVLEGMMYKDKDIAKQSDVVFPNGTYSSNIFPSYDDMMQPGEIGVFLTLSIEGKEMHEKLVTQMIRKEVSVFSEEASVRKGKYNAPK
jgi:hypothetical protein